MKLTTVVSIIFIIALIFLIIVYIIYFENLFNAYAYTQNSIMKYFLSPQQIKPNNKSITVNDTASELMYYNVSESELTELIYNTITFTIDMGYLFASIAGLIILYKLYIFLYFRVFIIRNLWLSYIFHALFPSVVESIIIMPLPISLGLIFSSANFPIFLTFLYALDHLLPLGSAYSIIDSLIFGLDIFLFVVEFLIERVTENEIASIPTTINKVKYFHSFNEILQHVINAFKLVIKILVIITFIITIATTFLAYFNIAYLIEDFYFVFFTMLIIISMVLFVSIIEFLVNISFKGMSYIERLIHTSKTRKSKNGNNKI